MKQLKFSEPLPKLILQGKKHTTWRIHDKRGIKADDILSLCYNNGKEFARVRTIKIRLTTFGKLTKEDKEGHEEFLSDKEMYQTYSKYYKIKVTPKTKVKIIKFKLI